MRNRRSTKHGDQTVQMSADKYPQIIDSFSFSGSHSGRKFWRFYYEAKSTYKAESSPHGYCDHTSRSSWDSPGFCIWSWGTCWLIKNWRNVPRFNFKSFLYSYKKHGPQGRHPFWKFLWPTRCFIAQFRRREQKQTKQEWWNVLRRSQFLGYMAPSGRIIDK
jgi:hypothetical protein